MILYYMISPSPCGSLNGMLQPPPLPLTKTPFLPSFLSNPLRTLHPHPARFLSSPSSTGNGAAPKSPRSSMLETPVLWAGRLCVYYALLKAGLAGSPSNPFISSELGMGGDDGDDLGFSKWIEGFKGQSAEKEASDRRKLVRQWHPTTKGTLKRSYRVPSKAQGQRLLRAIASLLSDDDHFVDATSHKNHHDTNRRMVGNEPSRTHPNGGRMKLSELLFKHLQRSYQVKKFKFEVGSDQERFSQIKLLKAANFCVFVYIYL